MIRATGRRVARWTLALWLVAACSSAPETIIPADTTALPASPTTTLPTAVTTETTAAPPHQETPPSQPDKSPNVEPPATSPTTSSPPESDPPTTTVPSPPDFLRFVPIAQDVSNPIFLTAAQSAQHSYLAEQGGRIHYLTGDEIADPPVLDITNRITFRGEQGLLGIALHPTDPTRLFVHYSDRNGHTVVSEFSLSDDGRTADPNSERLIFFTRQPATNHNGGMIQFGPDGHLYLGLGDGGRADDFYGHGQRPDTPLAALVRIDPDQATSEVWWYGLRNPWRFWIDGPTGLTYIADVGQNAYEEISVAPIAEPGLNFGWPITEGLHCFEPRQDCDPTGQTLPVLEIAHDDGGTCSVTGGVVYRGAGMPGLWGHYFYSDYCGGYLRSFLWNGALATELREWASDLGSVVSLGTDESGEMYILTTDAVYRVEQG